MISLRPGQLELLDPHHLVRARLTLRARLTYEALLNRTAQLRSGGRLAGVGRISTNQTMHLYGLDKRAIPALERAGAVRWEGDDLLVVGWRDSAYGKEEAFCRRQAKLARLGAAARWGGRKSKRDPDRDPDLVLSNKHSKSFVRRDAERHAQGNAPPGDLLSEDRSSGSGQTENDSSSGSGDRGSRGPAAAAGGGDRAAGAAAATLSPRGSDNGKPRPAPAPAARPEPRGRPAEIEPWPERRFEKRPWVANLEANREHLDRVLGRLNKRIEGPR